jgi:hypothetical protein
MISSLPSCGSGPDLPLSGPTEWESGASLPRSWSLLYNLVGYANGGLQPLSTPICHTYNPTQTTPVCHIVKGVEHCSWTITDKGTLQVRFEGTDGVPHVLHTYQLPPATFNCSDQHICQPFTESGFFANRIINAGGLAPLLTQVGGTTTSVDVLNNEGAQILAAEQVQNYRWDANAFTDPNPVLRVDATNLSGAFELLQLLAQTVAPAASLGNQALSDLLYGQDQLPTILTGPNSALAVFQALRDGTGTPTLTGYANVQYGRLAELKNLLTGYLASAQQAATAPGSGAADLPTAEAPAVTYTVLAQLATGAALDIDTVTVNPPGAQTAMVGTAASLQPSASSSAGAAITSWSAAGLPPGLSINPSTGLISGTPTTAGSYPVTVTATDTVGSTVHDSGNATFVWTVRNP